MTEQTATTLQLQTTGLERLRSGEHAESVARDLARQGLPPPELESLFLAASGQQRRSGMFRIIAGVLLLIITSIIFIGASEAGIKIYGPGLLIGLFVLVNGFLKIKNGGEIARAIQVSGR